MGKFYAFLLGLIAGMAVYHLGSSYHVIQAETGLHMVPKIQQGWEDTYADVREYSPADWADHARLAAAIAASDNEPLKESALDSAVDNALESLLPKSTSAAAEEDAQPAE